MKSLWPLVFAVVLGSSAPACDLCAIYSATQARGEAGKGFLVGVAEQFTHYGTLQSEGSEVANPAGQFLDSSISQVFVGYNPIDRFGIQFNAPIIYRSFRRPEGSAIVEDTEAGLSDTSLLANFQAYRHAEVHSTLIWNLQAGVKFPTGSTRRLEEETHEVEPAPGQALSGIHGHDLTLGSGSYDGLLGTSMYGRWHRLFLNGAMQYAIRSQGDYEYQFANDLTWTGGPGYLVLMTDDYTLAAQVNVSGETKGRDEFHGETAEDTGITSVYVGPQISGTWHERWSAEVGLDLPVLRDNTALQIVPDYRVRLAMTLRF